MDINIESIRRLFWGGRGSEERIEPVPSGFMIGGDPVNLNTQVELWRDGNHGIRFTVDACGIGWVSLTFDNFNSLVNVSWDPVSPFVEGNEDSYRRFGLISDHGHKWLNTGGFDLEGNNDQGDKNWVMNVDVKNNVICFVVDGQETIISFNGG